MQSLPKQVFFLFCFLILLNIFLLYIIVLTAQDLNQCVQVKKNVKKINPTKLKFLVFFVAGSCVPCTSSEQCSAINETNPICITATGITKGSCTRCNHTNDCIGLNFSKVNSKKNYSNLNNWF